MKLRLLVGVVSVVGAVTVVSGCGNATNPDVLPVTIPVLTTLRPELTTTTIEPVVQRRVYVVQPGDTLSKIATGFEVSVKALMEENGKEDTFLRIGETLVIPPSAITGSG